MECRQYLDRLIYHAVARVLANYEGSFLRRGTGTLPIRRDNCIYRAYMRCMIEVDVTLMEVCREGLVDIGRRSLCIRRLDKEVRPY